MTSKNSGYVSSEKSFWDMNRAKSSALLREVSPEEIKIIQESRPFLEVVSWRRPEGAEADILETLTAPGGGSGAPSFVTCPESGWQIQYWIGNESQPSLMSSAPGDIIYGGRTDSGQGTFINQAFMTALAMLKLAKMQNWPGIQMIGGSDIMRWAAWAIADHNGMASFGYTPGPEDKAKQDRIEAILNQNSFSDAMEYTQSFGMSAGGSGSAKTSAPKKAAAKKASAKKAPAKKAATKQTASKAVPKKDKSKKGAAD